mmetsp:Transcript_10119/g.20905  ORF Transcript_10119/g.20905 Transcript_10119/m.20905 type:complete len:356 (-) Transcript_10119:133-1200(-)
MGFLEGVKKAALKAKLMGDIALLDRQVDKIKRKSLGIELFTVLLEWGHANMDATKLPIDSKLVLIYNAAKEDVLDLVDKKELYEQQLDDIEVNGNENSRAGNATRSLNLRTKMAYYDREIYIRKELFGMQVYDELEMGNLAYHEAQESKNVLQTGGPEEKKEEGQPPVQITSEHVVAVFERIRMTIQDILKKKLEKEREMAAIYDTDESTNALIDANDMKLTESTSEEDAGNNTTAVTETNDFKEETTNDEHQPTIDAPRAPPSMPPPPPPSEDMPAAPPPASAPPPMPAAPPPPPPSDEEVNTTSPPDVDDTGPPPASATEEIAVEPLDDDIAVEPLDESDDIAVEPLDDDDDL